MMESLTLTNGIPFNNILYIGDEPGVCLSIIEKFNACLTEIEHMYVGWFTRRRAINKFTEHDKLRYHIHYHFEGGIAIFKFKNDDELPSEIRKQCIAACRNLAAGQLNAN